MYPITYYPGFLKDHNIHSVDERVGLRRIAENFLCKTLFVQIFPKIFVVACASQSRALSVHRLCNVNKQFHPSVADKVLDITYRLHNNMQIATDVEL